MKTYLFYIEGLDREVEQDGESESAARKALWDSLSDDERDRVVIIECVDDY